MKRLVLVLALIALTGGVALAAPPALLAAPPALLAAPPRTLIRNAALTSGKKADLIILDPGLVNFAPRVEWISQIVFNGQPANVEWVFVDGRALKARGRLVGVQPAAVMKAADEVAGRIRRFLSP